MTGAEQMVQFIKLCLREAVAERMAQFIELCLREGLFPHGYPIEAGKEKTLTEFAEELVTLYRSQDSEDARHHI